MSGTTTYFGVTYPTSTDYVKDGATAIQTVATGFDSAVAIPTYNAQTGATYTFALTDIGKTVTASNASAQTYTIPPQASVVWVTGTTLNVVNLGAGVVTFAAGAGVTVTNTAGTISQYQSAALVRTALNAWTVIPFAGGVAPLTDSAVSATTGSPTTATYTNTLNCKTYAFTGSGSITFSKAGLVDVMVVSGGGGTGSRGGGGGSAVTIQTCYVTAATHTVTIAAGGASSGGSGLQGKSGPPSSFGVGTNRHDGSESHQFFVIRRVVKLLPTPTRSQDVSSVVCTENQKGDLVVLTDGHDTCGARTADNLHPLI